MRLYDAGYHDKTTTPAALSEMIRLTAPQIKEIKRTEIKAGHHISHIAATGISGLSAAFALSTAVELPVAAIRRRGEKGAHSGPVIGIGELGDYIIVDDLISTGATINHIVSSLMKEHVVQAYDKISYGVCSRNDISPPPTCRAIFLYRESGNSRPSFTPRISLSGDYAPLLSVDDKLTCELVAAVSEPWHPPIPVIGTMRR